MYSREGHLPAAVCDAPVVVSERRGVWWGVSIERGRLLRDTAATIQVFSLGHLPFAHLPHLHLGP